MPYVFTGSRRKASVLLFFGIFRPGSGRCGVCRGGSAVVASLNPWFNGVVSKARHKSVSDLISRNQSTHPHLCPTIRNVPTAATTRKATKFINAPTAVKLFALAAAKIALETSARSATKWGGRLEILSQTRPRHVSKPSNPPRTLKAMKMPLGSFKLYGIAIAGLALQGCALRVGPYRFSVGENIQANLYISDNPPPPDVIYVPDRRNPILRKVDQLPRH